MYVYMYLFICMTLTHLCPVTQSLKAQRGTVFNPRTQTRLRKHEVSHRPLSNERSYPTFSNENYTGYIRGTEVN